MSINIMSLPIDVLEKCFCKSNINKFIQNEVFNKNIKKFLIDMIKDNTFNNKIIKISILQDLDFDFLDDEYEKNFEYLFSLIDTMDLSKINNILNKYKSNDIWNNSSYYCLSHTNYVNLFYADINYDISMLRNTEYIKNIFTKFINYAEELFLFNHYDNMIYETSNNYDLIDELINQFIESFNLDFENFITNYGIKNLFNDFYDIDIDDLQDDFGLEIIICRVFKHYIKCHLEDIYDEETQIINIIYYKNYIYKTLFK